ncbi:universal stress protein [Streptomyces sp. NBC_01264]|uniref:universal stress protein n=1 Tax=Streptomyces sp. NBC_01264 TaxID=2903804 RepID=UPI002258170B|nr:universal stress protein [Streptomyces sp. NBC_01264]MCX4782419.1 universal stress protein [Streptomyces sp. NBC_01264]
MRGRVVVGVYGSLGSLTALHAAHAEARAREAELWAVLAWQPPLGGPGARRGGGGPPLLTASRDAAVERLREVLDTAFGGSPAGVTLVGLAVRGTPGAALVGAVRASNDRASNDRGSDDRASGDRGPGDLLVVGTGPRGPLLRALRPSVSRYCLRHAPCPVLAVPPGPLRADLNAVRRRIVWRRPLDAGELVRRAA